MGWVPWAALVVVVGVALGVGSSQGGPPATAAQRADAVDGLVRCPSCDGISVADSSASTAVAIRRVVAARVHAGQTDAQIDAFLVSRYGPGILLRPPVHGWTAWVWLAPPAVLAGGVVGLVTVLWRRRSRAPTPVSADDRVLVQRALAERAGSGPGRVKGGAGSVTRAELDDERSFLLDSLEDLERERAAGDLSDADYQVLRDRYTRRAAEVLRALDGGDDAGCDSTEPGPAAPRAGWRADAGSEVVTPPPPRRRRRTLVGVGVLAVVAASAVAAVAAVAGTRLPGQTATGSVSLSRAAQLRQTLAQAETLEAQGNAAGAVRLYDEVLASDPTQPEALAESGWLDYEAGAAAHDATVLEKAQQLEQEAQRAAPGAYAPRLYLGSMLLAEGDDTGAVAQYRHFLADGPPQDEVRVAASFIDEAFRRAHQPVPVLPGATTATTTPATTAPTAG